METEGKLVSNGTVTVSCKDTTQYSCPVHGITTKAANYLGYAIDRTPHISVTLYEKPRYHCLLCYAEWLEKNIPVLTEVTP